MRLSFDTIEEILEFVSKLKGQRTKKGDADEATAGQAPQPLAPPAPGAQGFPGTGGPAFAPPAGGAAPGGAFPAAGASVGPAPEVTALITRIGVRIDGAVASGQPAESARAWLAGQCGPECVGYTLDQLKTIAMPKLSVAALDNIAKMMNA